MGEALRQPFVPDLSRFVHLPHLPSLAGEQNHLVRGRHFPRSNRTSLVERYGPRPVLDSRSSRIGVGTLRRIVVAPSQKLRAFSPGVSLSRRCSIEWRVEPSPFGYG